MTVNKLLLYNDALTLCGERLILNVNEQREPRYLLDQAWDFNAVQYCLEQGLWKFAMHTVELEYSPSVVPSFGLQYAFNKPDDYVRTAGVCQDAHFRVPLLNYVDEANYLFADMNPIYLRYVSNDPSYGNDMGKWPATFQKYVSGYLANAIVGKLTQDKARQAQVEKAMEKRLLDARSKDAMNAPTTMLPAGTWVRSRFGRRFRDGGGTSGNLTG